MNKITTVALNHILETVRSFTCVLIIHLVFNPQNDLLRQSLLFILDMRELRCGEMR